MQITNERFMPLLAMCALGLTCVLPVLISGSQLSERLMVTEYELWELGALFWSMFFGVFYYFELRSIGSHFTDKILNLVVFVSFGLPIYAMYLILREHEPFKHLVVTASLALCYFVLDLWLKFNHKDHNQRDEYHESFWLADVPTVVGMTCLLVWVKIHSTHNEQWEPFAAGAIAFQLISCNVTFLVTQFGVHRPSKPY